MAERDKNADGDTIDDLIGSLTKPRPKIDGESDADRKKRIAENAHEAKIRRLAKECGLGSDTDGVHYILDGKDDPLVKVAKQVFAEARKRKVN